MKKIVSLIPLGEDLIEKIKARTKGFELVVYPHKDYRSEDLADAEIILGWSSKVKEALKIEDNQIKWIQIWYAGVDRMPLESLDQCQRSQCSIHRSAGYGNALVRCSQLR